MLLFNLGGYVILMSYLQERADAALEKRLDAGKYDEANLVQFKIPVSNLPYYTNSTAFERKCGQLEINGRILNYVKLRIYNDTLEVYCIPNPETAQLQTAKDEFFRLANNLEQAGQGKNNNQGDTLLKFFSGHYLLHTSTRLPGSYGTVIVQNIYRQKLLSTGFACMIEVPPEHC